MADKFYAVKKGLTPGIYTKWSDCQQNINGFSGAEYKSFSTEAEARVFLGEESAITEDENNIERVYTESEAIAYVDGSYNTETKEYACGIVIMYKGGREQFAEKFSNPEMAIMHNVAGEIEGAIRAMKFCVDNNINSIDIFYDYEGIEKWCTNAWKANKPGTQAYKNYYNSIKDKVKVTFVKVKSHSGNKLNDLADTLAKSALGLCVPVNGITNKGNGIVANGIELNDLKSIFELLSEDFEDLKINEKFIPYGKQFVLNINVPTNQTLNIQYFEIKNKLYIFGPKEDIFCRLTKYILELLAIDEIPNFLNTVHDLNIDLDVVESEFIKRFPNSHDKIPSELHRYLHQAVYNLQVKGNVYVANYLTEPVIRPLEGILKLALVQNDFPIRREGDEYDSFFIFKERNNSYVIKTQHVNDSHSKELLEYLGRYYTYYQNNRHTLFHWDNPTKDKDTTRILNTVEEAVVIIHDVIALIDEYFAIKISAS